MYLSVRSSRFRRQSGLLAAGLVTLLISSALLAEETDRVTGLITAAGWQQVQANCTACHSAQLILQNSGSREVWKSRIVWMQDTQGLEELDPEVEAEILDYLATNYGPKAATRRAGLPAHLLPENPYSP